MIPHIFFFCLLRLPLSSFFFGWLVAGARAGDARQVVVLRLSKVLSGPKVGEEHVRKLNIDLKIGARSGVDWEGILALRAHAATIDPEYYQKMQGFDASANDMWQ